MGFLARNATGQGSPHESRTLKDVATSSRSQNHRHLSEHPNPLANAPSDKVSADYLPMTSRFSQIVKEHRALIVVLLAAFAVRMLWFQTPVVRDEGCLGYFAMAWSNGYPPYSEPMAANAAPLAISTYHMLGHFWAHTIEPIRVFNNLLFVLSVAALYSLVKNWYGKRTALVSAVFYSVFMNAPVFETHLAIQSSLSLPFVVFAVYFFGEYLASSSTMKLFLSGVMMSFAFLMMQYHVVGIAFLFAMMAFSAYSRSRQENLSRSHTVSRFGVGVAVLLLSVLLPIAVFGTYYWSQGALGGWVEHTMLTYVTGSPYFHQGDVSTSLKILIAVEGLPLWIFAFIGFVSLILRVGAKQSSGDNALFCTVWLLVSLIAAVPAPHHGRHFSQIVAPASVLAAIALDPVLDTIKFKCTNGPSGHHHRSIVSVFLIGTLLVSLVLSGFLQANQYPNSSFSLWGQSWEYTFSRTRQEQRALVNYLRGQNGPILVHGWEAELYWLSGHLAPSVHWATSYGGPGSDISTEGYQEILDDVKDGYFDTVVLMYGFEPDQIMSYVDQESSYSYVSRIGNYDIYSYAASHDAHLEV